MGEFYKKDIKHVISSILDVVSRHANSIITLEKEYKVSPELGTITTIVLETGFLPIYLLFNMVLGKLGLCARTLSFSLRGNFLFISDPSHY